MAADTGTNLIVALGQRLDELFADFIRTTASKYIDILVPIAMAGVLIYFTLKAWMIMSGRTKDSLSDLMWDLGRISLCIFVGLTFQNYSIWAIDVVNSLQSWLLAGVQIDAATGTTPDLWGVMQSNWLTMKTTLNALWVEAWGSYAWQLPRALGFLALWLIGWAGGGYFFYSVLSILVLSKIAVTVMLAVGPIFICLAMWPATKDFFSNWTKTIIVFVLNLTLITMVGALFVTLLTQYINVVAKINDANSVTGGKYDTLIEGVVIMTLMSFILSFVVRQVPTISQGLIGKFIGAGASATTGSVAAAGGAALGAAAALGWKGLAGANAVDKALDAGADAVRGKPSLTNAERAAQEANAAAGQGLANSMPLAQAIEQALQGPSSPAGGGSAGVGAAGASGVSAAGPAGAAAGAAAAGLAGAAGTAAAANAAGSTSMMQSATVSATGAQAFRPDPSNTTSAASGTSASGGMTYAATSTGYQPMTGSLGAAPNAMTFGSRNSSASASGTEGTSGAATGGSGTSGQGAVPSSVQRTIDAANQMTGGLKGAAGLAGLAGLVTGTAAEPTAAGAFRTIDNTIQQANSGGVRPGVSASILNAGRSGTPDGANSAIRQTGASTAPSGSSAGGTLASAAVLNSLSAAGNSFASGSVSGLTGVNAAPTTGRSTPISQGTEATASMTAASAAAAANPYTADAGAFGLTGQSETGRGGSEAVTASAEGAALAPGAVTGSISVDPSASSGVNPDGSKAV